MVRNLRDTAVQHLDFGEQFSKAKTELANSSAAGDLFVEDPTKDMEALKQSLAKLKVALTSNQPNMAARAAQEILKTDPAAGKQRIAMVLQGGNENNFAKNVIRGLVGDGSLTSINALPKAINGESRLHIACQSGNLNLIKSAFTAHKPAEFFEASGPDGQRPIDHLEQLPQAKRLECYKAIFDACLEKGDDQSKIQAGRLLKGVPGGKKYATQKLKDKQDIASVGMKALLGIRDGEKRYSADLFSHNFGSLTAQRTLLHLACEGGNTDLIKDMLTENGQSIFDDPFGSTAAMELLPREAYGVLVDELNKLSEKEKEKQLKKFLKLPGRRELLIEHLENNPDKDLRALVSKNDRQKTGGVFSALSRAASVVAAGSERKARLGSDTAEGEQMMASPSSVKHVAKLAAAVAVELIGYKDTAQKLRDDNYENRVALFKMFEGVERGDSASLTAFQNKLNKLSDADKKYLQENTFHFLGGVIAGGHFELAQQMIGAGLFNEVSPRLLSMMNMSPLTHAQHLELCKSLLVNSKKYQRGTESALTVVEHLVSIPGGKEVAQEWFKNVNIELKNSIACCRIASLLGDVQKLKEALALVKDESVSDPRGANLPRINPKDEFLNFKSPDGKTLMHYACMSDDPEIIKAYADWHAANAPANSVNPFLVQDKPASVAGRLIKAKNRPINHMSLDTALKLDAEYKIDSNKPGSFASAVLHEMHVRQAVSKKYLFGTSMIGKLAGDAAIAVGDSTIQAGLGLIPGGHATGLVARVAHGVVRAGAADFAASAPTLGGAAVTAGIGYSVLRGFAREVQAENLGLDRSLSAFNNVDNRAYQTPSSKLDSVKRKLGSKETSRTPLGEALVDKNPNKIIETLILGNDQKIELSPHNIRRLGRIPTMTDTQRTKILGLMISQAPVDDSRFDLSKALGWFAPDKPGDGNKQVESLLEDQVRLGHGVQVKEAILSALQSIDKPAANLNEMGKLRSFMITAARLGDMDLMNKIAAKTDNPESLWLDTFVRRGEPAMPGYGQLDRGCTLMHIATMSGNPEFMKAVADEWSKYAAQRRRSLGAGEEASYQLPTTRVVNKVVAKSGGSGRMREKLPTNPWDMKDASGRTPAQMLGIPMARKLDELSGIDPKQLGSLTRVAQAEAKHHGDELAAELGLVMPAKVVVSMAAAPIVLGAVAAGTAHGIFPGIAVAFVTGNIVFGTGGGLGIAMGKAAIKARNAWDDVGHSGGATLMDAEAFKHTQQVTMEFCRELGVDELVLTTHLGEQVKMSRPEDILAALNKIEKESPGFRQGFEDKLRLENLIRTGAVGKDFQRQVAKLNPFPPEFVNMNSMARKSELNNMADKKDPNLELYKQIDRYLDAGLSLSQPRVHD